MDVMARGPLNKPLITNCYQQTDDLLHISEVCVRGAPRCIVWHEALLRAMRFHSPELRLNRLNCYLDA